MSREVVFIDGTRTPFGKRGGTLRDIYATDLAVAAVKGLLEKTQILEKGGKIDSVFMGSAAGCGHSYTPARYITLMSGIPTETSASFVEMQCGSAIDCINHAAWKIMSGCADVIIAGGFESHSNATVRFSTTVAPYSGLGPQRIIPVCHNDPAQQISMIEIADKMAAKWGITREQCDEFAFNSQMRAAAATEKGYFKDEIVPVKIAATKKTPEYFFDQDEHLRPTTTLEGLAKLKPVRGEGNVTTAGNASGLNDGAACVLMMTAEKAKELGYEPIARYVTGADVGVEPYEMGIGPAYSNLLALKRAGLTLNDMDVMECNEAFAAQNLAVIKEMEIRSGMTVNRDNWNPNGGAISFGHPNGASGGRICIFLMKELARRGGKYGFFSSCCGGGQGTTVLIENLCR